MPHLTDLEQECLRKDRDALELAVLLARVDISQGRAPEAPDYVWSAISTVFEDQIDPLMDELINRLAEHVPGLLGTHGDFTSPASIGILFEIFERLFWAALTAGPVKLGEGTHIPHYLIRRGSGDAF